MKLFFDSNVIIDIGMRRYSRDVFSSLWEQIESKILDGSIVIIDSIAKEIKTKVSDPKLNKDDWRQFWLEKDALPFNQTVQEEFTRILKNEQSRYIENRIEKGRNQHDALIDLRNDAKFAKYCRGADLILIATAKVSGGIVVTSEIETGRFKIPQTCIEENVECIDFLEALRQLEIKL